MEDGLPYRVEYAKSGRASCRGCKGNIGKDTLRLAAMVQSPMFDGKVPYWYHQMCFFGKQRPQTVADIAHFDSLRWEDQQKIKAKIESGSAGGASTPVSGGKGSKKAKKGAGPAGSRDYAVEYAKSSRAVCRGCEEKIKKDEVRVSKKDFESERARRYGPMDLWHHVDCFVKNRAELEFFESGDMLPGYNTLSADDKKALKGKLKKVEVKRKAEDEPDTAAKKIKTEDEEAMRKQNKIMFKYRDELSKILKKKEFSYLLEYNDQYLPEGESSMLDVIIDVMTFGKMEPCEVCESGRLSYMYGKGYICHGNITEWTRCTNVVQEPKRSPFKVPEELREAYPYLAAYKFKGIGKRVWVDRGPTSAEIAAKKENGTVSESTKALEGMKFAIVGNNFTKDKKKMKATIKDLGGEVTTKIDETTAAVITTLDCLGGKDKKIASAKALGVHCVSEDFVDEVEKGNALLMIEKKSIAQWGGNPQERVTTKKSSTKSKSDLHFVKSVPEKQKLKLKGGAVVDPDSGLENSAHVYQRGDKIYNSVLGLVDIQRGTNSYYKLQVLRADNKNRCWVFRSWGRIGTTIGNNKLEEKEDINDAIAHFQSLYEEKTGNRFNTDNYKKLPGCWYPLDIDYGQADESIAPLVPGSDSKLPKAVQELVALIFDVDMMKKSMVEFEIDLKKMPLGKLSKKQIESAYKVLSEALGLIEKLSPKPDGEEAAESTAAVDVRLLDCSNRFYTLIPHDFGMKKPPLLNDVELIKLKIGMLDNLSEIEVAYSLLKSEDDKEDKNADPIDKHYRKLKTKMEVLDKKSDEFKMVQDYVANTHATTHSHYQLVVEEAFKIERQGEKKRFKPFKQLPNHQLLWHGSRLTNFVGILSQGLRIAPPEAPVTGYMFGKGVYFADMVSKSANYCCTSQTNPTGLILLCDVALGEMYERKQADYIEKLPKGKHSTKGLGRTCPDPSQTIKLEDGVEVPLGKGTSSGVKNTSLLYNEFIVYDVAQINAKYLLKLNFDYRF